MFGKKSLAALALTALVAAGCNDPLDTVDESGCANISGSFTATNFTAVSLSNSNVSENLLGNGGSFTLTFNNGNFTSSFIGAAGGQAMTRTGAVDMNVDDGIITLGSNALFTGGEGGSQQFSCQLSGNTLTLTDLNTLFDFGQSGTRSPARITVMLVRNT